MEYNFYGWEEAGKVTVKNATYQGVETPLDLYEKLQRVWCRESCAPRMRESWSPENNTVGQCSITAFLAQDIFGGEVYGVLTENQNLHCYNVVDGIVFDLTSEQFGEKAKTLSYDKENLQDREAEHHFGKLEKRLRYEYIKELLKKQCEEA